MDGTRDLVRAAGRLAQRLPDRLAPYAHLAFNYWWSWAWDGASPFADLDPDGWERSGRNPVRFLRELPEDALRAAASDPDGVYRGERLLADLRRELSRPPAVDRPPRNRPVAFLAAEFGVHPSLPIYAGGLGVLSGDILKEASDLGLPMAAVGILYRQGYFHQRLDPSGRQHEYWSDADVAQLPAALVTDANGAPITVTVPLWGRDVVLQVWRVNVGRVPLYLLDAWRPENAAEDRWITARLYVGDRRFRLGQYAILGLGAIRALRAMDVEPSVVHINEGHAALATLELRDAASPPDVVFTTHTPVPAGNESFPPEEILDALGERARDLLPLGRPEGAGPDELFGLTVLGIRTARSSNGVSRLHGEVSRSMWGHLGREVEHVTNGVHLPTWMAPAMRRLLDRYLGAEWYRDASEPTTWKGVDDIPDDELWDVRCELRARLVRWVRQRATLDRLARGEPHDYAVAAASGFDPNALTIGFARRVATYKRLYLLVHDPARALALLGSPAQLVMAGKAHPMDEEAKGLLVHLFSLKRAPNVPERAAYLENYDMSMAAELVAGCDVWLNLPRAPLEASGTSGMKAALNGALNLSVLDGWWDEAYDGENGWAIPRDDSGDPAAQDDRDAGRLYDVLEREVAPLFADRDGAGVPAGWVRRIKSSLRTIGPGFCATRMMRDYAASVY